MGGCKADASCCEAPYKVETPSSTNYEDIKPQAVVLTPASEAKPTKAPKAKAPAKAKKPTVKKATTRKPRTPKAPK